MVPNVLVIPAIGERRGLRVWPLWFALPAAAAAVFFTYIGAVLPWAVHPQRDPSAQTQRVAAFFDYYLAPLRDSEVVRLVTEGGYAQHYAAWSTASLILGAVFAVAFVLTFVRRPLGLWAVRIGYILAYVVCLAVISAIWSHAGFLEKPPRWLTQIGYFGESGTKFQRFWWWYDLAWPFVCAIPVLVVLHVLSYRATAIHLYTGQEQTPRVGDRIVEDARVWGDDPQWRKSWLASAGGLFFVVIVLPWLLAWIGCSDRYYVPEGSGDPVVQLVQVVQPKKVQKEVFIINPKSAISFYVPKLEDSEVEEQVEEMTELEYTPVTMAMSGAMGQGGGTKGGWPDGMGRKPVRFIRIKGHGPGWDDGMDSKSRADLNFLDEFHDLTGFKVAEQSEAKTITQIANFDKGFQPPFVYMTGDGSIRIGSSETQKLREYLLDGGMLFADAGHPSFDRAFRNYVQRELFSDHRLIPIADDDPIFQMPFQFPNGAPPLWHHGGSKAMGVKAQVNGRQRWVIFYHPGDVNDAWKTGNSGLDPKTADGAFHMGINIIYYSFTHYLEDTRKYRK